MLRLMLSLRLRLRLRLMLMLRLMLSLNFWLEVAQWEDLVPEELLWVEVASWEQCTLLLWEVVLWEESDLATLVVLVLEAELRSGTLQWELVSLEAMDQWEDSVVLVSEGLQWEVLAGLALWEQCILVLLEEVLLVAIGLQEDLVLDVWDLAVLELDVLAVLELDASVVLELDVLDWEALLEPVDLWEQSPQLLLEEVLSGVVSSEESDMVDLLEESAMVDLLEESDMVDL